MKFFLAAASQNHNRLACCVHRPAYYIYSTRKHPPPTILAGEPASGTATEIIWSEEERYFKCAHKTGYFPIYHEMMIWNMKIDLLRFDSGRTRWTGVAVATTTTTMTMTTMMVAWWWRFGSEDPGHISFLRFFAKRRPVYRQGANEAPGPPDSEREKTCKGRRPFLGLQQKWWKR